jgi:hypothetical protein
MEKKREFKTSIESFGCINYDLDQDQEQEVTHAPKEEQPIIQEEEVKVPEPIEPKERKNKPNLIERKWL